MNGEVISDKQGVILIMAFIIGETSMETLGLQAEQNLWIVIILSISMGVPVMLIYARLHYLFPNKDLFDIIEFCLGKFIGKGIMLLFIWYMYDVTSNIVKNLSCFTITVTLNNTPMLIPIIVYMTLCAGVVLAGFDVIVRWTEFFYLYLLSS
ncbi:GerAB/ArcD/ProY family transporter [Oceanirhabdus seepicola]|uniref:GerAB/ArcD/ProY family transporter n=1 Tax=Oceanirhabdus seepicola TaxID=2828781 RepID=A0A9J6NY71_9CLOT|nr:GerAB/ArcD/ProY family transporter [Oceanirhabdus seepicola]MCM1988849.1 GerAB/ArcD/ProY family transporter [Oceanirhabdus seepicola]